METVRRLAPVRNARAPLVPALLDMEPTSGGDEAPEEDAVDPVDDRLLARCRIICCWFIMISWAALLLLLLPPLSTGFACTVNLAGFMPAPDDDNENDATFLFLRRLLPFD